MNTQPTTPSIKRLSVKAVLASLACVVLAGCVSERTKNTWGTLLFAVNPGNFSCAATPDLRLKIEQTSGDASGILCATSSGDVACTNPTPTGPAWVNPNQVIQWELKDSTATDPFYVIFDQDKSPAQKGKNRGANIVASENGKLCIRVNGQATATTQGEPYRYSVYVKHCASASTCTPKVLDPIIYVRKLN